MPRIKPRSAGWELQTPTFVFDASKRRKIFMSLTVSLSHLLNFVNIFFSYNLLGSGADVLRTFLAKGNLRFWTSPIEPYRKSLHITISSLGNLWLNIENTRPFSQSVLLLHRMNHKNTEWLFVYSDNWSGGWRPLRWPSATPGSSWWTRKRSRWRWTSTCWLASVSEER